MRKSTSAYVAFSALLLSVICTNGMAQPRGDVAARNFTEYCAGPLGAERQARFDSGLQQAEQALAANDADAAYEALADALSAVYRGDFEADIISVKCLGKDTAQRWHSTKLAINRLRSEKSADYPLADRERLYLTAVDAGSSGLISDIQPRKAVQFTGNIRLLQKLVSDLDNQRQYGAYLLPEEEQVITACNGALKPLIKQANENRRAALAAEEKAFNLQPSDAEMNMVSSTGDLALATTGVKVDTGFEREGYVMGRRVDGSMEQLRLARDWDLERYSSPQGLAASKRARARGDVMQDKAGDTSLTFTTRDQFFEDAIRYYKFGDWREQGADANAGRAAIQGDLQAEQARREAINERAEEELDARAEAIRDSVDGMKKTEAEKQSFNEEADALEAELGF